MFCARMRWLAAAVLGTHLAFGQAPATRPAPPTTAPAGTVERDELKACLHDCRRAFSSIEEALRSIEQAEQGEATQQTKDALGKARGQLIDMRGRMSRSLQRLENLNSGSEAGTAWAGESWACTMHPQVRQDRPGNCPICDGTLRNPVAATSSLVPAAPSLVSAGGVGMGLPGFTAGR